MNRSEMLNGGAYSTTARITGNHTATAGGAGDNALVNGDWIDRMAGTNGRFEHGSLAQSAKLSLGYSAVLAAGKTLAWTIQFQDADDIVGAGAANYGDPATGIVSATGESGGSTEVGTFEQDVGLEGARRFIRAQITPNLSAASVDSLAWGGQWVFYGFHNVLPTKSGPPVATP